MNGPGDAAPRLSADSPVHAIARACAQAGGRALVVGGWVRDQLLGREGAGGDLDLEVQGLAPEALERVLARFGAVRRVGRAFPVYLVPGLAIDVCLPRTGAPGEDGAPPGFDPGLPFAEAARGRDLRVNAMAWDPLTGELLDPYGGRRDIAERVLRATDPERFGSDPLRGLRTAQLAARLEMEVDASLRALCAATDLSRVAPERVFGELRRLLLSARQPSRGLALLHETGLLRFFPELLALVGCPQDPRWHPEGDVFVHTLLVVDVAAGARRGAPDDLPFDLLLLFGALCHDLGKPATREERDGRIVSHGHCEAGVAVTEGFLERLRAPSALVRGVAALVRHHLAPAQLAAADAPGGGAGPRAYRRLLRKLRRAGVDAQLLYAVARADHLGRTTDDARRGVFAAGDVFLARARAIDAEAFVHEPVVRGRHLMAHGVLPGPAMGRLLDRCQQIQDETGATDPEEIVARVLAERERGA